MLSIKARINLVAYLCVAMVAIHVVNMLTGGALHSFGILPGRLSSLPFIFTAPWVHGGWGHLISNLMGFGIFSGLCLIRGFKFYVQSSFIIIVLTGILVWLFARSNATHIGASGWIFGLWSLSIAIAWFERSFLNIIIAVFVAVFYGGMVFGVLPTRPYISFESHLFGALSGIVAAYVLTRGKTSAS